VEFNYGECIEVLCKVLDNGVMMKISFLRASTNFQERIKLWNILRSKDIYYNLLWLCIRDFNEVLY